MMLDHGDLRVGWVVRKISNARCQMEYQPSYLGRQLGQPDGVCENPPSKAINPLPVSQVMTVGAKGEGGRISREGEASRC